MSDKKYTVITYMRIEPEHDEIEPVTLKEAQAELSNLELMCPEDKHIIEEVDETDQT